jgi:hypothetical protein
MASELIQVIIYFSIGLCLSPIVVWLAKPPDDFCKFLIVMWCAGFWFHLAVALPLTGIVVLIVRSGKYILDKIVAFLDRIEEKGKISK